MTLYDIVLLVNDHLGIAGIVVIAVLSLVEVSKIKINPFSFINNLIFKNIMLELKKNQQEVIELRDDIVKLSSKIERSEATESRYRILRFNDEILHNKRHSKEHFDQILHDIDVYNDFCQENPDYKNNMAVMAIQNVKRVYQECSNENDFL